MNDQPGNNDIGHRFFAEQDRLRGGPAPELCAHDYEARLGGNPPMNRQGHEAFAKAFYAAFPDMHHDVEDVFSDGAKVAVRFVIRGNQTGAFFGIPPTNREIAVTGHVLLHVDQGRVRKLFGVFDEAGLLRQIGALPG